MTFGIHDGFHPSAESFRKDQLRPSGQGEAHSQGCGDFERKVMRVVRSLPQSESKAILIPEVAKQHDLYAPEGSALWRLILTLDELFAKIFPDPKIWEWPGQPYRDALQEHRKTKN